MRIHVQLASGRKEVKLRQSDFNRRERCSKASQLEFKRQVAIIVSCRPGSLGLRGAPHTNATLFLQRREMETFWGFPLFGFDAFPVRATDKQLSTEQIKEALTHRRSRGISIPLRTLDEHEFSDHHVQDFSCNRLGKGPAAKLHLIGSQVSSPVQTLDYLLANGELGSPSWLSVSKDSLTNPGVKTLLAQLETRFGQLSGDMVQLALLLYGQPNTD